jgi:hypothetical protein
MTFEPVPLSNELFSEKQKVTKILLARGAAHVI